MSSFTTTTPTPSSSPPPALPLTLIVATTPSWGIGHASTLPWPALRAEMAYFARVTRRAPAGTINAVLMGRKTWESIPGKFRPLKGRLNVVVSRRGVVEGLSGLGRGEGEKSEGEKSEGGGGGVRAEDAFTVGSLEEGVRGLRERFATAENMGSSSINSDGDGKEQKANNDDAPSKNSLHRVFVIGGAELYKAALALGKGGREGGGSSAERVLRTSVKTEFPCDVFFSVKLGEGGEREEEEKEGGGDGSNSWTRRSKAELDAWVGEDVPAGLQRQGEVEWEFEMWEKEKDKEREGGSK